MAPLLAGVAPLGVAIGAAASMSSIGAFAGWSTSWVIFSGTPQMLTLQLTEQGAAAAAIVLTVAAVNLRLTVYSAALATTWQGAPLRWKLLACALLTDPCYAVAVRDELDRLEVGVRRVRYLAAALTLWIGWLASCGLGVLIGPRFTEAVPARLVLQLVLVSMVVSLCRERMHRRIGVLAAALAVPAVALPMGSGTLAAAAAAVAVGARLGRSRSSARSVS